MPGSSLFGALPLTHPMLASLAVVGVFTALFAWRAGSGRRWALVREVLIVMGGFFVYFSARGATAGEFSTALANANAIVQFERELGWFVEPTVQAAIIGEHWIVAAANWVYIWGHWPVIAVVAFWLWRRDPGSYRLFRNAFVVSGAIGLLLFMSFPTAPPRLAGLGLTDTLTEYSQAYQILQPKGLVNQYAAFPSLHFGWSLLVGIAVVSYAQRRSVRAIGVLMPLAMLTSIVLTANHFWIDAAAGGAVALLGLAVAFQLSRIDPGQLVPQRLRFGDS